MTRLSIFLPDKISQRVKEEAKDKGISLSEYIRRVVELYLESKTINMKENR